MRCAVHVARSGEKITAFKVLVGKPEGRPRRRWGGMDWIHLAQDRDQWTAVMNTAMNLRFP
jgi:hypothetical protein